jgi:hypothetical protein
LELVVPMLVLHEEIDIDPYLVHGLDIDLFETFEEPDLIHLLLQMME